MFGDGLTWTGLISLPYKSERSKLLAEGSGLSPATPELDSAMGVGSRIDLSNEDSDDEDNPRQVLLISKGERSKLLADGSGLTPATLEPDSAMGVGSWIDPSKEDSDEIAYRQLKELVDEPLPSGSKEDRNKPNFKLGMRSGAKKNSKS